MLHKKWVMDVFDRAAPDYGERWIDYFNIFGEQLVSWANLSAKEKVLDVATGKGAVLLPALRIVPPASITGIDISHQMLEELKKKVPEGVALHQMDAEHLDFPDQSFDVVFCAFALYFFPNVSRALSEFKRVLKKGGRLAISSFAEIPHHLTDWAQKRAKELGATRRLRTLLLKTPQPLIEHLMAAGFSDIEIQLQSHVTAFESPDAWWDSLWSHGVRGQLEQLSPNNLEILHREALAQAHHIFPNCPIKIEHRAILALAKSAESGR